MFGGRSATSAPQAALYSQCCVSVLRSQQKLQSAGCDVIAEGRPADQRCSAFWCQRFEWDLDPTNTDGSQFVFFGPNQSGKFDVYLALWASHWPIRSGAVLFYLLDRVLVIHHPAWLAFWWFYEVKPDLTPVSDDDGLDCLWRSRQRKSWMLLVCFSFPWCMYTTMMSSVTSYNHDLIPWGCLFLKVNFCWSLLLYISYYLLH